ncbi:hypothetical protein Sjap_018042 [Stephania japonica]|uniref:PPPDE domain-containing protein n=1 Tax=Stephania japonica TaxID=461633 RepID=A0AAP0I793_9MAGN
MGFKKGFRWLKKVVFKTSGDLGNAFAEAEEEVANIATALDENKLSLFFKLEKRDGTPKDQLSSIKQTLEELQRKREERMEEFCDIQLQIIQVHEALRGSVVDEQIVDDKDLTTKRLKELKTVVDIILSDVSLQKISDNIKSIHEFSDVLSVDLSKTMDEVLIHPSLCSSFANNQLNNISDVSSSRLGEAVDSLKQEKERRLRKLQDLPSILIELWNMLDTPVDERERFDLITTLISAKVDEVTARGSFALDIIKQANVEIEKLKASKMEKLVLKKQKELEEINKSTHIHVDTQTARHILITSQEFGDADISGLLSNIDEQILKTKELALSRKEILDKIPPLDSLQQDTFFWLEQEEENKRPRKRNPIFVPVYLNVYDLHPINGSIYWLGLDLYHSGIQVHAVEYEFGGHDSPSTGIFKGKPRKCPGLTFRKSILIGRTDLGPHEVHKFMEELSKSYTETSYNLITKNCNHFCNDVSLRLLGKQIPRWINRLAKISEQLLL